MASIFAAGVGMCSLGSHEAGGVGEEKHLVAAFVRGAGISPQCRRASIVGSHRCSHRGLALASRTLASTPSMIAAGRGGGSHSLRGVVVSLTH